MVGHLRQRWFERLTGFNAKIARKLNVVGLPFPASPQLGRSDLCEFRPLLEGATAAKGFLDELFGRSISIASIRLKHAYDWIDGGERLSFVNLRHDTAESGWGGVGYLLKINHSTGQVWKIFHPEILEDRIFSGAEDPRYFWRHGRLGVIFNGLCRDGTRRLFIYFYQTGCCIKLQIQGFALNEIEKNWTAFVVGDTIYLVYSFNPTIVLKLDDEETGECSIISGPSNASIAPIKALYPYGGSSLVQWDDVHFVGLIHTRQPYRPAMIVFNADEMRVVAVGKPFSVPEPAEAIKWRGRDVQYPYHIELGKGHCEIWIECQDRCPTKYTYDFHQFCEMISTLIGPAHKARKKVHR